MIESKDTFGVAFEKSRTLLLFLFVLLLRFLSNLFVQFSSFLVFRNKKYTEFCSSNFMSGGYIVPYLVWKYISHESDPSQLPSNAGMQIRSYIHILYFFFFESVKISIATVNINCVRPRKFILFYFFRPVRGIVSVKDDS